MNEKRFRVVQNSGNLLSETLKDPKPLLLLSGLVAQRIEQCPSKASVEGLNPSEFTRPDDGIGRHEGLKIP